MTEAEERVAQLFVQLEPIEAEVARLQRNWFTRLATVRRQKALLIEADDLLAEIAGLLGTRHTPIRALLARNPVLPGRPVFWFALQWTTGLWNAYQLVDELLNGRYWLAPFSLLAMLICALWRVPPWRLVKQGKYNND